MCVYAQIQSHSHTHTHTHTNIYTHKQQAFDGGTFDRAPLITWIIIHATAYTTIMLGCLILTAEQYIAFYAVLLSRFLLNYCYLVLQLGLAMH